jgi:hypothetical protein
MADNQIYYFQIGAGRWHGGFSLAVTSWRQFWQAPIGVRNRCLVVAMVVFQKLTGQAAIDADFRAYPERGAFGIATNVVRIHKWALTLYFVREEYILDPDGSRVTIQSEDYFGPLPFLFRDTMEYPAEIHAGAMSSTYHMPLLGATWTCDYRVHSDRNAVDGTLRCAWAEARETIRRVPT